MVKKHAAVAALLVLAACAAGNIPAGTPGRHEQELRAVLFEAEPMVRSLLTALNAGDYAAYVRDFDAAARAALPQEQFARLHDSTCKGRLGPYEEGKCQVNKIEKYPGFYRIYYFVKFRKIAAHDPVILQVKVVRYPGGLKIAGLAYRHAVLAAQGD